MVASCFRQRRQAATAHRWEDLHTGEAAVVVSSGDVAVPASCDESDRVLGGGGSLRGGTWG